MNIQGGVQDITHDKSTVTLYFSQTGRTASLENDRSSVEHRYNALHSTARQFGVVNEVMA